MTDVDKVWALCRQTKSAGANLKKWPPTDKNSVWYKIGVELGVITPTPGTFSAGVCASAADWSVDAVRKIGAKIVRVEFGISKTAQDLDWALNQFGAVGCRVQPLAGYGTTMPSSAQARNVGTWAQRHGPNGTGIISTIEFGNETSYSHNFPGSPANAGDYARRFAEAYDACKGTGVGLLCQIDDGGRGSGWADGMFQAVPDLASKVAGWVIHPYHLVEGPKKIDRARADLARHGDTTLPFYFTEWGISIDEGYTLSDDNYQYPLRMTYAEGAAAFRTALQLWQSKLGKRFKQVMLYRDADMRGHGDMVSREQHFGVVGCPWAGDGEKGAWTQAIRQQIVSNP